MILILFYVLTCVNFSYQHPEAQLLIAVKWNHVEEVER